MIRTLTAPFVIELRTPTAFISIEPEFCIGTVNEILLSFISSIGFTFLSIALWIILAMTVPPTPFVPFRATFAT